jgi:protein-disulfide isomerase
VKVDKRFWGILIVIILVFGGIFIVSNNSKNNTASSATNNTPTNHTIGQDKDKVTLLEYGDYQCPYCSEYAPVVSQIATAYAPYITFQFSNLPLTSLHPNAFAGARAAEAAGLMGQFWQMHDILYQESENYYASNETAASWISSTNPQTYFDQFAGQLGLNVSKFNTDYASTKVNNLINSDVAAFAKTGAQEATPTFFLNGKQIQPPDSFASFQSDINAAIKAAGFAVPVVSAPTS